MKYKLNEQSSRPAYMQLYALIRDDIIDGVYKLGDKLPSKRIMADDTGVSVITVEHAYSLLDEEGYIEARERSGYFVSYHEEDTVHIEMRPVHQPVRMEVDKEALDNNQVWHTDSVPLAGQRSGGASGSDCRIFATGQRYRGGARADCYWGRSRISVFTHCTDAGTRPPVCAGRSVL